MRVNHAIWPAMVLVWEEGCGWLMRSEGGGGVIRLERCHMSIQLITGPKVVLRKWKDRSQTLNEVICA